MTNPRRRRVLCVAVCACVLCATAAGAIPATLLTNVGGITSGSLTGLEGILRVLRPEGIPTAGPDNLFGVPITSISHIFVDFPRVVIETADGVLLGPFSATTGASEALSMTPSSAATGSAVPFASVGQIALNGYGLSSTVPRIWLGDRFLTLPDTCLYNGDGTSEGLGTTATSSSNSSASSTMAWSGVDETALASTGDSGIPWWLGLLAVAALLALIYFNSSSSSS